MLDKTYLITAFLPAGIAPFTNNQIIYDERTNIPVLSRVLNVSKHDTGYLFDYNGHTFWTYYGWLFADDTIENTKLLQDIEDKQVMLDNLRNDIALCIKKITKPFITDVNG